MSVHLNKLERLLDEKFINAKEVAFILATGLETNKNIFLYGRGGHAKSEMINEFLKYIDPDFTKSYIQMCGEGLSEEKLFGGIDLNLLKTEGKVQYLVENSFMNKDYVVFEELLDSRLGVLLSLKDILTSGYFRNGDQVFKIKTKLVICLTNRTKQEVSEDDSIKALMERFPLELKVEWDSYSTQDYVNMFRKVLLKDHKDIAKICAETNSQGSFISPRTAIHMAQSYEKMGANVLKLFNINSTVISEIEKQNKIDKTKNLIVERTRQIKELSEQITALVRQKNLTGLKSVSSTIQTLLNIQDLPAELSKEYEALSKLATSHINSIKSHIIDCI